MRILSRTYLRALTITQGTTEWFFTSVDYFMLLQTAQTHLICKFVVTMGATKLFFTSLDYFMFLQTHFIYIFVVTMVQLNGFSTCVDYFMFLQKHFICEFVGTTVATKRFSSVWTISCSFRLTSFVNSKLQRVQLKGVCSEKLKFWQENNLNRWSVKIFLSILFYKCLQIT